MKTGDLVGGKYRLVRALGHGTMGSVWEALNERASRRVALKLIQQPSEETRQRLLSEARACGSLSHRNIVEVYDVGETETGDPFLVMQLLDGETLAACLEKHIRLPPDKAAQIARDIALALDAAHDKRIIHRDLKPANVYLHQIGGGEAGAIVKVVDFGVSRVLNADTRMTLPGMIVGSPVYMSPEQFIAMSDIDARTDIWSLGVCLFEMLTGVRPFLGKSVEEISTQVLRTGAPLVTSRIRHLDEGLATIVARCLKRDRAMRIGSAAELAALLEPYANARPDAPIIITPPATSVSLNGTVIMPPEVLSSKTLAFDRDATDGAPRQAPWREKPLDEILTATVAALAAPGDGSALPVAATNARESSAPVSAPHEQASEKRRPKRHLGRISAGVVVGIVGVTSVVVASRALSSNEHSEPPKERTTTVEKAMPKEAPRVEAAVPPKEEAAPVNAPAPQLSATSQAVPSAAPPNTAPPKIAPMTAPTPQRTAAAPILPPKPPVVVKRDTLKGPRKSPVVDGF